MCFLSTGWATEVEAEAESGAKGFAFYHLHMTLTEVGSGKDLQQYQFPRLLTMVKHCTVKTYSNISFHLS